MLHQQAWSFAIAFLAGISAGMIIDIYRVSSKLLGLRRIGTTVGDVLTWLIISLVAFALLLIGNWAELRLYVALALASGLIVYMRTVSKYFRIGLKYTFKALHWSIVMLAKTIVLPIRVLVRLLEVPWRIFKGLVLLLFRVSEFGIGLPRGTALRLYRNLKHKIAPPPEI